MRQLPVPASVSPRTSGRGYTQSHSALFLPWSANPQRASAAASSGSHAGVSTATQRSASPTTTSGSASSTSSYEASSQAQFAGLALLLWHSLSSLPQHAWTAVQLQLTQAAVAAERARRSIPPPEEVPRLMHWTATTAAVHAEESLVLALAHTATRASAATAGVPAVAAAVTGSTAVASAAGAATAPHLPLLRHQRRRLLAAALPLVEELRGLQQGCTTHVLLGFMLYSQLHPGLRRGLLLRLEVLARRAAQLGLLEAEHEAWLARQPHLLQSMGAPRPGGASPASTSSSSSSKDAAKRSSSRRLHPLQGRQAHPPAAPPSTRPTPTFPSGSAFASGAKAGRIGGGGANPAGGRKARGQQPAPSRLSARWYAHVLAPELLHSAKQLAMDAPPALPAPSSAPSSSSSSLGGASAVPLSRSAGGPRAAGGSMGRGAGGADAVSEAPGRFDLRDLYRLIRIVEVAVEDLQRQQGADGGDGARAQA